MQEYGAYVIGPDGHVIQRFDIVCADVEAAKARAKRLVNGYAIELWQLDRKIATFESKK
jgi:hypothetical protein